MKLKSLIPLQVLREAEDEKEDTTADSGEAENPIASADDADASDAEASEEGGEEGAEEQPSAKPLEVSFNANKARRYNKAKVTSDKGVVTAINKKGLTLTLPDQTTIFLNFEDIM